MFLLVTIGGFNIAWSLERIQNVQFAMSKAARVFVIKPHYDRESASDAIEPSLEWASACSQVSCGNEVCSDVEIAPVCIPPRFA